LPPAVVKTLNEEANKALAAPEVKERFAAEALEVMPMTPAEFGKYIVVDIDRWTKLARDRKIELVD
jgi:tripartite-type tricarboxylate transporter receptor subunit TctC